MGETDGYCLGFIEVSIISTSRLAAYLENSLIPWKHIIFLKFFNLAPFFEKK